MENFENQEEFIENPQNVENVAVVENINETAMVDNAGNVHIETEEDLSVNEKQDDITFTSNIQSIDVPQGDAKWYILHTFSGYEQTAKANLENVVENGNLHHRIQEIVVPEQEIVEEQNGKKKVKKIRTMPSYLFIKMVYGDDLWHTITRTRGVTGFVGPKGRPLPMTDDEIRRMHLEKIAVDFELMPGEVVEIIDGPLQGNTATIVSVDAESKRCIANVTMFGRENSTEISYDQIRKLN